MRILLPLFLVSLSLIPFRTEAACRVFVPENEFSHAGYTIRFDFTPLLEKKGYTEVETAEQADLVLSIEGQEFLGRFFHHALGALRLGETKVVGDRRCWTQFCGIGDFGKAFQKAYRQLAKDLPVCQ